MSRTEVTQGQWKIATGGINPSCFQRSTGTLCTTGNSHNSGPVELLDWYSALAYANWLSVDQGLSTCYALEGCDEPLTGWHDGDHSGCTGATFIGLDCTGYRLLTESEWERAARGGTTSTYYWGASNNTLTVGLYAWFTVNAGGRTQTVGGKQANDFGLYDTSGNVWEWVWDWYETSYPDSSVSDYLGPLSGSSGRTIRGGSWDDSVSVITSARRGSINEFLSRNIVGFRLARTAP